MTRQQGWELVRHAGKAFVADKATRLAAALAYYTALSMAPLLLVVVGLAGIVYGEQAARGELSHQLDGLIGGEGASAVQAMLAKSASPGGGLVATLVGVVTLLLGATGVFASLQDALDSVWPAPTKQEQGGVRGLLRDRLLSFSVICGMAFLLLVSLAFGAVVAALGDRLERWVPYSSLWMSARNFLLAFLLTTVMFGLIFKLLPHARPAWSAVWPGAVLTAVLFAIGKHLISMYLGHASVGSTFGAAGSFVVLLVWLYYSSVILLFGTEFTRAYAERRIGGVMADLPEPPTIRLSPQPHKMA